ncbi:MAG: hypothetical protein Q8Q18_01370 [bacterium]|nr:hypothetical protein [bacterium]
MDELAKLFGSALRVKILRAFYLGEKGIFTIDLLAERTAGDRVAIQKEIKMLVAIGFLKEKTINQKTKTGKKVSKKGYICNEDFAYDSALRALVINTESLNPEELIGKLKGKGQLNLVIVAGIFIDEPKSRADIIIVGDRLKRATLEATIRDIETDIGKDLTYGIFSTEEFFYRLDMYDKFMRDVLDYPHKTLLNKLVF